MASAVVVNEKDLLGNDEPIISNFSPQHSPSVKNIPQDIWPKFGMVFSDWKFEPAVFPPLSRNLAMYRAEMANQMTRIKRLVQRGNTPKKVLLEAISDYYHTSLKSHPFLSVNNSLLMLQVNYLLLNAGLNPVNHSNLDRKVFLYSWETFRTKFFSHVKEFNPDALSVE